ncbi:MAG: ribosome assembly RNA-binding protein YhbY [Ruminococcaceae bacterium]|nr:ribosome assembly RNA-binding protein YhbY [Oscillospiraceae bacterium]
MITSKQRAYLRGEANSLEPIFQLGKGGISDNFVKQVDDALEARELIKIHLLDASFLDARETVDTLARLTGAEAVQAIGSKIVLYRESKNKKRIELPRK